MTLAPFMHSLKLLLKEIYLSEKLTQRLKSDMILEQEKE